MDVATLGISVELKNGQIAAQGLDNIAAAGARAEQSTKNLSSATQGLGRFQQDLVNRAREVYQAAELLDVQNKSAVRSWEKQRDMWAEIAARHKQTAIVENELSAATQLVAKNQQAATEYARRFAEAQRELNAVNGRMGPGINSVRSALTSMTSSLLGAAPGVGQLTGVLGSLALGSTLMVGVLAGVAALAAGYRLFTEDARKAEEQQKKLTDSLLEWYRAKQAGGQGAQEIEAATKAIAAEQVEIDKLAKKLVELNNAYNAKTGLRDESAIASTKKQIADLTATIEEQRKAITAKQADDAQGIASAALQLERQNALNDAFGKGAVALARINAEFDYRETKLRNDAQYSPAVAAALDAIALKSRDAAIRTAELTEAQREAEELQKSQTKTLDELRAALEKTQPQWTLNAKAYEREIELNKQLNEEKEKAIPKIASAANKGIAEQDKQRAESLKKEKAYADDMQRIWRDGIGKIATDGTKSFQDFFEDVFQMFSKLMDRMKQEGGKGGLLDGLKAIWNTPFSAAGGIAAGAAGASAGYASGSAGGGLLSGAITGGLTAGPWGALIGGLAGVTGGLLGGAKAARERAEAEQQLRAQLESSLNQMRVQAGTMTELAASMANAHTSAQQLREQIEKAYPGLKNQAERERLLAETRADEATIVQKLADAEAKRLNDESKAAALDLNEFAIRQLIAQGRQDEADAMRAQLEVQRALNEGRSAEYIAALQLAQALEKAAADAKKANDAFFSMADAAYQAALAARNYAFQQYQQSIADPTKEGFSDALNRQTQAFTAVYNDQIKVLRDQLKVQQDAQKTAQQNYNDTKRALDSLTSFRSSLNTGQFSVLSPAAQVAAARQQVEDVFRQAQLGDKSAAGNFGGVAQSYLDVLRNYGASGSVFTSGQGDITKMADALVKQYGVQASIDQQMLDSANQQVDLLQHQIDLAQAQVDGIERAAAGIQRLYDSLVGAQGGTVESVWNNIISAALAQSIGGTPAGLPVGNPYAPGPNGLPFGNTSASGGATLAERFFYAFQQFVMSQSSASAPSPQAVIDATEENTDVLRSGFDALVEAFGEVAVATQDNGELIKQLARKLEAA